MPIKFKMLPKKNTMVTPAEVKYYPCAIHEGEEDLESLAELVATRSTMSVGDCYGVIMTLSLAIGDALAQGRIVRIDPLGSFQVTLKGTGADSLEPLGKTNIKGVNIVYKASKQLKRRLKTLNYKRIR